MESHDRSSGSPGRYAHPQKLTASDVARIRELRAAGRRSADIASDHGISQSLVCQIATGRLWRDAPGPLTRLYMPKDASLADRFWPNVDRSGGPDACWPWTGRRAPEGYGVLSMGAANVIASRASLEIRLGRPLGEGMKACHSCDNPPCCNPDHLFEGTNLDNVADCVAKGRTARKLSDAQVIEIRAHGPCADRDRLAETYGVTAMHIGRILRGVARRHVAASMLMAGKHGGSS